jgi:flagellar FliL protein
MPAANEPSIEGTPAKKGFGKKLLIIVLIVVFVALIGAGGVVWLLLQKKDDLSGTADAPQEQQQASPQVNLSAPPTFVSLDPFVVNLQQESGERYLQVIMAVRVNNARTGDSLKGFMPEIRHRINLRLSGKLPSEISNPPGQQELAREIAADINEVLGSPAPGGPSALVHSVLFNSFIIQ